jgi:hypothetical protein
MRNLATIAVEEELKFVEINFFARSTETDLEFIFLRENVFGNSILPPFLLKSVFKICFLIVRVPSDEIDIEYLAVGDDSVSRGVFNAEDSGRIN